MDAHYFYANGWAMRRVLTTSPRQHVDIGSKPILVSLSSGFFQAAFVDYRPLNARISQMASVGVSLLALPFAGASLTSVSYLHVSEHLGLGRYGDPINPSAIDLAANELVRVLQPGGNLFVAVPLGRPRVCFNAHRILAPVRCASYLPVVNL